MRDTTRRPGVKLVRVTVVALAALSLTLGVAPADAAPKGKVGPVRNLTVDITKPSAAYRLAASWDTLVGATSYQVSASAGGAVLASARVTQASWVIDRPLAVGSTVSVKVVPYSQSRPGKATTVSKVVPDRTAPTGVYAVVLTGLTATVTQTDVADDLSADADIVRQVDWDNGAGWQAWNTLLPLTHVYSLGPAAYHPRVRLTDEAGNTAVLTLTSVAIGDVARPLGMFTAAPGSAWARYSEVTVTQLGLLTDDVSAAEDIVRVVDWQDGTSSTWTEGSALRHVYATPGSYAPVVRLTDEAGKWTDVVTASVEVQEDSVAPKSSVKAPTKLKSVRAWKRLTGNASDLAGSGVRNVKVRIAEKRAGHWFAYRAPSRTWLKTTSRSAALKRSRGATVVPVDGVWSYSVTGLRKGTLVTKVRGTDNVGNRSKPRTYEQRLTRR